MIPLFTWDAESNDFIYNYSKENLLKINKNISNKNFANNYISKKIINYDLGLPYQGSKRKISHLLLQAMRDIKPRATHFYDCFGGGGSMSLNARVNDYITHYNELDSIPYLYFTGCVKAAQSGIKNKYGYMPDSYYEFITREKFAKILEMPNSEYKSFVLYCYSFGNNIKNAKGSYFCTKEKEIFKRIGHYFMLDNDLECAKFWHDYYKDSSLGNVYLELQKDIYPHLDWHERRSIFVDITLKIESIKVAQLKDYFKGYDYHKLKELSQKALCNIIDKERPNIEKKPHYKRIKDLQRLQRLERLQRLQRLEQLQQLQRLEQLEQLEQLQRLERLEQLQQLEQKNITFHNLDYKDFISKVKPNVESSILYCDIPYKDTRGYNMNFNHDEFYKWVKESPYTIFVSEYNCDLPFMKKVYEKEVRRNMNISSNKGNINECLFWNGK